MVLTIPAVSAISTGDKEIPSAKPSMQSMLWQSATPPPPTWSRQSSSLMSLSQTAALSSTTFIPFMTPATIRFAASIVTQLSYSTTLFKGFPAGTDISHLKLAPVMSWSTPICTKFLMQAKSLKAQVIILVRRAVLAVNSAKLTNGPLLANGPARKQSLYSFSSRGPQSGFD